MSKVAGPKSMRERVRDVMGPFEGEPSRLAQFIDVFILVCIVVSCAMVVFEHYYPWHQEIFWQLEMGFAVIFIIEYLLRWYAAPNRLLYPFTFLAIIDLLAVVPTLLLLTPDVILLRTLRGIRLLRVIRLLRLLRLLKFLRHGALIFRGLVNLQLWFSAANYQYRLAQLGKLFLWAVVAWFVGANILHVTETRIVGDVGPYAGYWDSYWNIIIVLISGIEDKEPLSVLGRFEVTMLLILGICVVSMLTGEIVSILVRKAQRAGKIPIKPPRAKFQLHILILGNNPHLDNIIRQLQAALQNQYHVLVVCQDAEELTITDPEVYRKVYAMAGDPSRAEVLEEAGVANALRVVVLASGGDSKTSDSRMLMRVTAVASQNSHVPVVAELMDAANFRYGSILSKMEYVFSRNYGARLISQAVLQPGVTKVHDELMSFSNLAGQIYVIPLPEELEGRSFKEAQLHYFDKDGDPMVLVGIERDGETIRERAFQLCPNGSGESSKLILGREDRLVVLARGRPLLEIDKEELWKNKILSRA